MTWDIPIGIVPAQDEAYYFVTECEKHAEKFTLCRK